MNLHVSLRRCTNSTVRRAAYSAAVLLLGACATPPGPKPGLVLDVIQREIEIAAAPAPVSPPPAVEASLLPPMTLESSRAGSGEARFDLSVQGAPAEQVFMAIVNGTPYSMLLPPELAGNVTLALKNVTVREVLDTLRDLYGYDYRVQGNRIFVTPNTLQTRVFQVNYLAAKRQGSTQTNLTANSITGAQAGGSTAPGVNGPAVSGVPTQPLASSLSGQQAGTQVSTTQNNDFWRDIQSALTALVGTADGRNVVITPSSGVIVIRALPAELRNVEQYLHTTQLVIERQVMLEAKIIEVSLNEQYQAGVNWANFGQMRKNLAGSSPNQGLGGGLGPNGTLGATGTVSSGGTTISLAEGASALATGSAGGFYGMAFQSANFAALLSFLETQGSIHVLSSPRVATLNNQKAVLKVGSDEFFVTNVSTTTTSGTGATTTTPTVTLQPFFSGISLDVTPQIDEGDQIILHVHPSVSTVSEKTKTIDLGTGGNLTLPLAASSVNESDSIVRVRDGQIVAIGGLMRQRQSGDRSGLPGTNGQELTLLGQRERQFSKSELVILMKPTVLRGDADWRAGIVETHSRLRDFAPAGPVVINGR